MFLLRILFSVSLLFSLQAFAIRQFGLSIEEQESIVWLFSKAQKHSGLVSKLSSPLDLKIYLVSTEELSTIACKETPKDCQGMAGLYDTKTKQIYLRSDLNPSTDKIGGSFLLHEMVHSIQNEYQSDEEMFGTCEKLYATESLAYTAQDKFLKEEGQFFRAGNTLRFFLCN